MASCLAVPVALLSPGHCRLSKGICSNLFPWNEVGRIDGLSHCSGIVFVISVYFRACIMMYTSCFWARIGCHSVFASSSQERLQLFCRMLLDILIFQPDGPFVSSTPAPPWAMDSRQLFAPTGLCPSPSLEAGARPLEPESLIRVRVIRRCSSQRHVVTVSLLSESDRHRSPGPSRVVQAKAEGSSESESKAQARGRPGSPSAICLGNIDEY